MFKKLLAMALILALALSAALPASAMTAVTISGDASEDEAVLSVANLGDTLYYVTSSVQGYRLYTRPASTREASLIGEIDRTDALKDLSLTELFAWNDQLCLLDAVNGCFYTLLDAQGALNVVKQDVVLDASPMLDQESDEPYALTPSSLFAQGDYLYYCCQNYNSGFSTLAGRISLTTGAQQTFETPNIIALCGYENGQVVAYLYDATAIYSNTTDNEAAQAALRKAGDCVIFDPDKDEAQTAWPVETDGVLGGFAVGGFCYGGQTVYFTNGSRVMGMDMTTGETRVSAYSGEGIVGGANTGIALYANGYYVTFGNSGMDVYKLDSESLAKGALRVYGEMGSAAHKSFTRNYPDIPVEVGSDYTSSLETITQAMVSDTNPYDVLLMSLNYMPVDRLLKKGYCADLSGDPALWDIVNQMYPEFGQVLQQDGKLYGVPVDATAYTFGVNMELWEELGLTQSDLPTSVTGLLDFAANWAYDYGEDHPDIYLFDYNQSGMMMFSVILYNYLAYVEHEGQDILFDTPVYRELIKAYEAVDFTEIDNLMDKDTTYVSSDKALFGLYAPVLPISYSDENVTPLYLSLTEDAQPVVAASTTVMIINPKTTRMDEALLYMKNYLSNLSKDGANITLFPDHNDPVEMKGYSKNLEELNGEIEKAQERLNTADAENKASIQDELASLQDTLKEMEAHRYTVSAEQIAAFRETLQPLLYVQRQNILYGADNTAVTEINTLMMQYIAGAVDADKMITELDNRLRLMALEEN